MAIQTVTNQNLAEYVAKRQELGSVVQETPPAVAAAPTEVKAEVSGVVAAGGETISDAPDPGKAEPSAKTNPVQPRINELTRQKKEAEEFAEEEYNKRVMAERRMADLEAEVARFKAATQPPEAKAPVEPKAEDFANVQDYVLALTDFKVEQKLEKKRADDAAAAQQRQIDAQNELMRARVEQAKAEIPDYVEVIQNADERLIIPGHVAGALIESELGPQLGYYLCKPENEAEAKKLFAMTPAKALLELGKIEVKLAKVADKSADPPPKPPETTRAPAPIAAVSKDGGNPIPTDLSKPMTFQEYRAQREAQLLAKRKRH